MKIASIIFALEAQLCEIDGSDRRSDEYIIVSKARAIELNRRIGYEEGLIDGRAACKNLLESLLTTLKAEPADATTPI